MNGSMPGITQAFAFLWFTNPAVCRPGSHLRRAAMIAPIRHSLCCHVTIRDARHNGSRRPGFTSRSAGARCSALQLVEKTLPVYAGKESAVNIDLVYDQSAMAAPAAFRDALNFVAQTLDREIANPITVNIGVGYGEDKGQPLGAHVLGEGGPTIAGNLTYSQLVGTMREHVTSAADASAVANLPKEDPTHGGTFAIPCAEAKAWGLLPADGTEIDGYVGFSSTAAFTYDPFNRAVQGETDFFGVAMHELTHALGRVEGSAPDPLDLFRYSASGELTRSADQPIYFSVDGGRTDLGNFDTNSDPADWAANGSNDCFNCVLDPGVATRFTQADQTVMEVLGYRFA